MKRTDELQPGDRIRHRHDRPFRTVLFVHHVPRSPTTLRVHVAQMLGLPSSYWANPDDEWEIEPITESHSFE